MGAFIFMRDGKGVYISYDKKNHFIDMFCSRINSCANIRFTNYFR